MLSLFVTGAPRTGTTLLDKLLSRHPRMGVYSQPLPLLYVQLKQSFLRSIGHPRAHCGVPLNDMFLDNYYSPPDLVAYLRETLIDADRCREAIDSMIGYDGQYTRPADPHFILNGYRPCTLQQLVSRYCIGLDSRSACRDVIGSKETFCEEFIPHFLEQGAHVVQIVRDPRDSIASMICGDGPRYTGAPRPLLFNVRQWRKSVAFAFAHLGHARFVLVRYETLVDRPEETVNELADRMELPPLLPGALGRELRTQSGEIWTSNSSHRPTSRVTRDSVGAHRGTLPAVERRFIEACCFHEMRALDYEPGIAESQIEEILEAHAVDAASPRPELRDWGWSKPRLHEEAKRVRAIRERRYDPAQFLFERAFRAIAPGLTVKT